MRPVALRQGSHGIDCRFLCNLYAGQAKSHFTYCPDEVIGTRSVPVRTAGSGGVLTEDLRRGRINVGIRFRSTDERVFAVLAEAQQPN
jgi:hypothetical protein